MVTRVYTPLIQPYNRTQAKPAREGVAGFDPEEEKHPFRQAGAALREQAAVPDPSQKPSGGLQSVQMDRFQRIPLKAVLTDFKNTMTALGADEKTQSEVAAYLNVVSLQAAKERPEVPFIKHTLRTAAGSLDQFITNALGQPSQVVKEWVDALLLQDIDYKAGLTEEETAQLLQPAYRDRPAPSGEAAGAATPTPVQSSFTAAHKSALKSLIDGAKQDQQAGRLEQADAQLQEALNLLAGKTQPALEGKVWHMRGRFQEKNGRWEQALSFYGQAAERFAEAGTEDRQAQSLSAMGRLLEDHGRLAEARDVYAQVVSLDEQGMDKGALVQSLNDLGSAQLRLGETEAAVAALRRAWQEGKQLGLPPLEAGDLLSNLGAAYRLAGQGESAIKAYKRALACAEEAQDAERCEDTLRQLAALFVAANQPEQAMKALQRLTALPR